MTPVVLPTPVAPVFNPTTPEDRMSQPEEPREDVRLSVELAITYHVTVDVRTYIDVSLDEIRAVAMRKFNEASSETWWAQFRNVTGIDASRAPGVAIGRMTTRETS